MSSARDATIQTRGGQWISRQEVYDLVDRYRADPTRNRPRNGGLLASWMNPRGNMAALAEAERLLSGTIGWGKDQAVHFLLEAIELDARELPPDELPPPQHACRRRMP